MAVLKNWGDIQPEHFCIKKEVAFMIMLMNLLFILKKSIKN